ncbi:MAG: hypothetical protein N3E51_04075 [Candidatus Micrarchaeota archaeon]|nr:hypothetical protein [Candidatus Micrarchaeota archaeon]
MWYKEARIALNPPVKRSAVGTWIADREKAMRVGARYRPWKEIAPFWLANAGITRPYPQFILGKPMQVYGRMLRLYQKGDIPGLLDVQEEELKNARRFIKTAFGDERASVLFDSNGSCVISTIAKGIRAGGGDFKALTFTSQGRLVYSALGFEAKSVSHFAQNFDQPIALFDHDPVENKLTALPELPPSVIVIDIFDKSGNYVSDERLCGELEMRLKAERGLKMILLLHVARTGRVMPVGEMAQIAKAVCPQASVFIDGCQAVGRLGFDEIRQAYASSDGYVFVGHKALGSMVCGAAVLKEGMEERIGEAARRNALFYSRLFQFESPLINSEIAARVASAGKAAYLVSAPEIVSLVLALEDSLAKFDFYAQIARRKRDELMAALRRFRSLSIINGNCRQIDDIISFSTRPRGAASQIKEHLQRLSPPVTIAPISDNWVGRIAIDPKLPFLDEALSALLDGLRSFFSNPGAKAGR